MTKTNRNYSGWPVQGSQFTVKRVLINEGRKGFNLPIGATKVTPTRVYWDITRFSSFNCWTLNHWTVNLSSYWIFIHPRKREQIKFDTFVKSPHSVILRNGATKNLNDIRFFAIAQNDKRVFFDFQGSHFDKSGLTHCYYMTLRELYPFQQRVWFPSHYNAVKRHSGAFKEVKSANVL